MTRPARPRAAVAALLLLVAGACERDAPPPAGPSAPPNILVYVVDTLRADALPAYGNTVVETPTIDALAADGVLYPEARSVSSWTRASVASMLTGLYPEAHGVETRADAVAPELTLLPELLSGRGYTTAAILTNPNLGSFYGFDQGFDTFVELYDRSEAGPVSHDEPMETADVTTDRAIAWLESTPEPFFLFVLAIDPHNPYRPPDGYDRYAGGYRGNADGSLRTLMRRDLSPADRDRVRSLYWGEVAFTDAQLGRLLEHLRQQGRSDRTAVLFTSDHGEEFWEHRGVGHGRTLFEESLRVPLIVRLPPASPPLPPRPGAESIDLFPTILDLARVETPTDVDGVSLFAGTDGDAPSTYASLRLDRRALRALVQPPWKLVRDVKRDRDRLYDLDRDPAETRDVRTENASVAARMRQELDTLVDRGLARRATAPQRADHDLPDDARALLEELGYLQPAIEPTE